MEEDKVKWPSRKKYTCKRGKGEHIYGEPKILLKPSIHYIYGTGSGVLWADKHYPEYKYLRTEISIGLEVVCKNCGHKALSFLTDKIK